MLTDIHGSFYGLKHTQICTHPFLSLGSSLAYGISTTAESKTNVGL